MVFSSLFHNAKEAGLLYVQCCHCVCCRDSEGKPTTSDSDSDTDIAEMMGHETSSGPWDSGNTSLRAQSQADLARFRALSDEEQHARLPSTFGQRYIDML